MARSVTFLTAIVALVVLISAASALQFDIMAGYSKCLKEELSKGQIVSGTFKVPAQSTLMMKFWVEDSRRQPIHHQEDIGDGSYAFTADIDGNHYFCFLDVPRPGAYQGYSVPQTTRRVTLEVRFDEETEAEKSALALQDKLKPLEQELVRIESVAHEVKSEAMHTREREATHRDTSGSLALESINSRITWLSVFSIGILVVLGVWQIYAQREFLRKKKII